MCGIAGIVSLLPQETLLSKDIVQMNNAIRHRGPDDEGYMLVCNNIPENFHGDESLTKNTTPHISTAVNKHGRIALGHRRLSINDLTSSGHQPMNYLDRYWIVFNGEIYNFIEIRETLVQSGYTFQSSGDTEVILAAYDFWGEGCLTRFNGMWAIVIYDRQKDEIFISRDRFGIKPIYYFKNDSFFIFSSEIKSIIQHSAVVATPDLDYCRYYIKWGAAEHSKQTAFKNIYRFQNASYFKCKVSDLKNTPVVETKFHSLQPNYSKEIFDTSKANDYANQYFNLLKDCVRLRLRSDVKVGSALSGGLDSSSVVYLVNQLLKEEGKQDIQETFSSVYKSPGTTDCDESVFIDQLSAHLNVHSNQIEPNIDDIITEHRKMIWALDDPPEGTLMSSWHTFKLVPSTNVKVTLDGQGADEEQAGYLYYLVNYFTHLSAGQIYSEYKKFIHIPGSRKFILSGLLFNFLRRLGMRGLFTKILNLLGVGTNPFQQVNEALYYDIYHKLFTLIHYADRTSMAFSIESRMPFMDYRMLEFWLSVPASYKLHNGWTKYISRMAMQGHLPDNIVWRKDKIGWAIPQNYWFNGPLQNALDETISQSEFIKTLGRGKNIRNTLFANRSLETKLRLFNLSVWHNLFFEKNK